MTLGAQYMGEINARGMNAASPEAVSITVQPRDTSSRVNSGVVPPTPPSTVADQNATDETLAVRVNTIRTVNERQTEFKRELQMMAITGVPILLATIAMLICDGLGLSMFERKECEDSSKLKLWSVVNMVRILVQLITFSYLLYKNINVTPVSPGGRVRAYLNTFGLLWIVIGLYFVVTFRKCKDDLIYQFVLVFVFSECVVVLLPCILFILMLPVICFCLPCVLRVLVRMQLGHPKGGTQDEINKIPVIKFGECGDGIDYRDEPRCSICLTDYEKGEELRVLPCEGRHKFHKACVDDWLVLNGSCPYCRESVCGNKSRPNSSPRTPASSSGNSSSGTSSSRDTPLSNTISQSEPTQLHLPVSETQTALV